MPRSGDSNPDKDLIIRELRLHLEEARKDKEELRKDRELQRQQISALQEQIRKLQESFDIIKADLSNNKQPQQREAANEQGPKNDRSCPKT